MEVIIGKWMKEQQETLKKEEEERKNLIVQKSVKKQPCALVLGINASCLWITNSSWNHMERPFFTGLLVCEMHETQSHMKTSYFMFHLLEMVFSMYSHSLLPHFHQIHLKTPLLNRPFLNILPKNPCLSPSKPYLE